MKHKANIEVEIETNNVATCYCNNLSDIQCRFLTNNGFCILFTTRRDVLTKLKAIRWVSFIRCKKCLDKFKPVRK